MSESPFYKKSNFWQIVLLSLAAVFVWLIFYPGLMSPDSIAQYEQARAGVFNDWHPPLMAIMLSALMKLGGDIGLMILIQCLLAVFGLRRLILLAAVLFSNQTISRQTAGIVATIATLLFLIPFLTPFMFFSVIFWKDAWLMVMLLWIASGLISLFLKFEEVSNARLVLYIVLISFISGAVILMRHNAVVVLPVVGIFFAVLGKIKFGKKGLAFGALPLLVALVLNPFVNWFFQVKPIFLGNEVLASDLATMLKLYPELEGEYPLTARHKNSPILFGIDVGLTWDESTEGKPCPYIECNEMPVVCYGTAANTINIDGRNCYMPIGNDNRVLKAEYQKALTTHPAQLIYTKLYLFAWMVDSSGWRHQKVAYDIIGNPFGLKPNERFSGIRSTFTYWSMETGNKWYFLWVSGIHILWTAINILLAIYFAFRVFRQRDLASLLSLILLLIPLSYYFSYILASVAQDYRFMYPSTLLTQAFTVSIIASVAARIFFRPASQ